MKNTSKKSTRLKLPRRNHDGNKGTFGRLLIVGGSDEMIGAPVLAGMAALRMGAGWVQVAVPKSVLPAVISICPEIVGMALGNAIDSTKILEAAGKANALVIGPGLGQSALARARLKLLIALNKPMVIDADGLNILAHGKSWPAHFNGQAVLTPHPGEMMRLAALLPQGELGAWSQGISPNEDDRIAIARLAARTFGQVVLLKGHRTVITDGHRVHINRTGDSTLAKAGSGDILSGIIGCLLAQQLEPFDAACLGAHLHGMAGELAGKRHGQRSAIGREVIEQIAPAIQRYERR